MCPLRLIIGLSLLAWAIVLGGGYAAKAILETLN
jgi:hypothetical protein